MINKDTEITGWAKLALWLELDVPDTDFEVILSEILTDGSHIKLSDDFMRARYHETLWAEKLITPGEINCYEFSAVTFFSRMFKEGSRLRLLVHCPNYIVWEKNYNSGG